MHGNSNIKKTYKYVRINLQNIKTVKKISLKNLYLKSKENVHYIKFIHRQNFPKFYLFMNAVI